MERLFVYLTDLSSNSAYLIIFGILVACGLGFPLPEDIPLIASGYLVWDGTINFWGAFAVTMLGVLIGDTILFVIGKRLGLKMLDQPRVQTFFKPKKIRRVRAYFRKYGDKIVFFARFVAGFRAAAFFLSGAMKVKYRRFIMWDALAALLSVPVWIAIGYGLGHFFGDQISDILKQVKHLKNGMSVLVFAIVAIVVTQSILKYRKSKQLGQMKRNKLRKPAV